jgi:hypothetical protein
MIYKGHWVYCQLCSRKRHVEDTRLGHGENKTLIVCKEHYIPPYARAVRHIPAEKPARAPFNTEPEMLMDGSNDHLLAAPVPLYWNSLEATWQDINTPWEDLK